MSGLLVPNAGWRSSAGAEPSNAWNIEDASFVRQNTVNDTSVQSVFVKPDGLQFYFGFSGGDEIAQWTATTPWDFSTASEVSTLASVDSSPQGVFVHPSGTSLFYCGYTDDYLHKIPLSTPWTLSSAGTREELDISSMTDSPAGFWMNDDGTICYIENRLSREIHELVLDTPYDIEGGDDGGTSTLDIGSSGVEYILVPEGYCMSPDGTKLFMADSQPGSSDRIVRFDLSTPWDTTTASYVMDFVVGGYESSIQDVWFRADGLMLFVVGLGYDGITTYEIPA